MFEPSSRYASLAVKTLTVESPDGDARHVRYVERRFLPQGPAGPKLTEHAVVQGERLDQITAKYFDDPTFFWRVADANEAVCPEELTDVTGRRIVIALPHA